MKAKREHRIPLSERCTAIVARAKQLATADFVFEGREKKPLSNMAMPMPLRRMKRDVTVHGFRSTFRDWAAEQTSFPREVFESALAHTVKNAVEAAYKRTDHFDQRRELMAAWTAHCAAGEASPPRRALRARQSN